MRRKLAFLLVMVAGCFADDDQCAYYDYAGGAYPAYELRDPTTGVCEPYGNDYYCDDPCQPCPATGAAEIAQPDWAMCYGACEGLDETTCKSTSGCRAAYAGDSFYQCWATAPSGPVQGGDCSTYDALECSRHDDCVARHATGSPIGSFLSCAAESSVQDPGSCVGTVTCNETPPDCPTGTLPGIRNACYTGYCIPYAQCDQLPACSELTEVACVGRSDCSPTYEGVGCTCNGTSCTCQSWVFDSCKDM